ncbi:MAG: glycine cleavage system protein R [Gammaproteobacteria bacterium]|nr:glycine cleavage system protein R [Gammaproteobacteria bacterium]MDH5801843.1 glycine cleavage system protein R [Gammaproteobacteria bacterium]
MDNFLVMSALGKDRPGIVDQLSLAILDAGCSVFDSRMTVLGGEFAIIMLVSGKWNQLAKLEDQLPTLEERLHLNLNCRRTETEPGNKGQITYTIEVITLDHPGIVHQIAGFFSTRNINIRELNTNRYAAAHTGTPMFSIHMTVDIPADIRIASLREDFLDFCDDLNMDAVIEPMKS